MSKSKKVCLMIALALFTSIAFIALYIGMAAILFKIASISFGFEYTKWHPILAGVGFFIGKGIVGNNVNYKEIQKMVDKYESETAAKRIVKAVGAFNDSCKSQSSLPCGTISNDIDASCIVDADIAPEYRETEYIKYLKVLNDCTNAALNRDETKPQEAGVSNDYTDAILNDDEPKPQEAGVSLDKLHYAIPGYPMLEEYEEDIMPPRFYEGK